MPAFKMRQGVLLTNNLTTGSLGNALGKIQFGSGTISSPSFGATAGASATTATLTIANAATTDKVFAMPASAPVGLEVTYAYVSAASVLTVGFQSSGCSAVTGCQITMNYLLLAAS